MTHELEICVFSIKVVKSVELSIGNPRNNTISGYFSSWIYEEFCWLSEDFFLLIMLTKADILNAEPLCSALTTHHTSAHWWCLMDDVNVHPIDRMLKPTHILSYTVHLQGFAVLWWGQKQIPHPRLHSSSTILHSICAVGAYGVVFYTRGMRLLQEHARHCSSFRPSKFLETFDRAHHFW